MQIRSCGLHLPLNDHRERERKHRALARLRLERRRSAPPLQRAGTGPYGVEIKPLLVATIKRLPQRTIESTLPTPGTVCPGVTFQTPFGPSMTAVPSTTSRSVQPSIVVGLVSGVGVSFRASFTVAPVEAVRRGATIESLLASRDSGAALTDFVEAADMLGFCGASADAFRAIPRTIVSCICIRSPI
jgi:hypothetical protein